MPSREGSRVFLGNLPYNVRERDIERFFERYGRVHNIFIKSGKYGFCEFDDYRDADDAVYKLNGCDLNGERITVEHARGGKRSEGRRGDRNGGGRRGGKGKYGPPTRTNYRIIVENLSSRDLKDVMRRAGEVTFADAHNDKRNEGVVEFISRRDMERAIEKFDNHEIQGRRIKLVRDRSTSRSRSRSGSRSSYSRSRSRSSSRSRSRSAERKRRSASRESRSRRRRSSSHEKVDRRRSRSSSRGSRKDEGEDYAAARDNGKRSHSPEDVDQRDQENSKRRRSDQSPEHRKNNEEGEMSADEPPRNASPREEEVDADPPPPGDDE